MNESNVVAQYPNGVVREFISSNGKTFEAYIPNDLNEDTNVIMYEHGNEGYYSNWKTYTAKFETGSCDSVIIRAKRNSSMDLYNDIVNYYGLTDDSRMTVSFSGGTSYALAETGLMAKQNSDASTTVSVILDGYIPPDYLISNGTAETLKQGNAVVLAFGRPGGQQYYNNYRSFAKKSGVNMILFKDMSEYGRSHSGMNESFMEGGLLEYVEGRGELPDRYEIQIYDEESGTFITLDRSQVATLEDVYNLFGLDYKNSSEEYNYTLEELTKLEDLELRSEDKALESFLNNIRSAIRSSSITTLSCQGFSSSTMMPSQVPAVVNKYLEATTNYLSKLANETDQFAKIGESIKEMDFNLERVAREINDIDIVQSVYADVNFINNSSNENFYGNVIANDEIVTTEKDVNNENLYSNVNSILGTNNDITYDENVTTHKKIVNSKTYLSNNGNTVNNTEEIFDFDKIVSDNDKIVFECADGYKVVVHKENNRITGLEYYYNYYSENEASLALEKVQDLYVDNEYLEKVVQNGQFIKVSFNNDVYKDWDIAMVEKLFSGTDGYIKV